MEWNLFQVLAAGGDLSVFGILYLAWKFDKRLSAVELHLEYQKPAVEQ